MYVADKVWLVYATVPCELEDTSGKGRTTFSVSMDISQTSAKRRNTRGQGNDLLGRLSNSPSPPHSGRLLPFRSVDDTTDFLDLVKSEAKVVTLAGVRAVINGYCLPSVQLNRRIASPEPVLLHIPDTSIADVVDHLDKLQAKLKASRRILAFDSTILYIKEMPSAIHSRATSYVVEHVAFALRQCLPVNAAGVQSWDDIELAGDGRKYPYPNPQPTY